MDKKNSRPRLDFIRLTIGAGGPTSGVQAHSAQYLISKDKFVDNFPQLYWSNGVPWHEANLWALNRVHQVRTGELSMATLVESASGLVAYMNYLEASHDDWRRIGDVKANRTTARYRGYLIGRRSAGEIAASTASARMAVVIRFYRWLSAERLLVNESQEAEKKILIRLSDRVGAQRSLIRTLGKV